MIDLRAELHRILLGAVLLGNALLFAGVDPPTRAATALLVLVLVVDLPELPAVPRWHRWAGGLLGLVLLAQLIPLPEAVRDALQPGLAGIGAPGWAPLSVAPWATLQVAAAAAVTVGIALSAARLATTRSGLPVLLTVIAGVAAVLAVSGLIGEAGTPERVLLIRPATVATFPYGPYLNPNHFAQGLELSLPAAVVLLAVAVRRLPGQGPVRQQAAAAALATGMVVVVAMSALLRCGSRGGAIFLGAATLLTLPLWWHPSRRRRWPWLVGGGLLATMVVVLVWARLPALRDDLSQLLLVEGLEGNTRWDLWRGTVALWGAAPVLGSGLGSYRHVIGPFKPATGSEVLEHAHSDWLEWAATGGVVGAGVLALLVAGCVVLLWPPRLQRLRFEFRYPAAGAALALVATALHEGVGFGLQTPANRYLLAAWLGLLWGLWERSRRHRTRRKGGTG